MHVIKIGEKALNECTYLQHVDISLNSYLQIIGVSLINTLFMISCLIILKVNNVKNVFCEKKKDFEMNKKKQLLTVKKNGI